MTYPENPRIFLPYPNDLYPTVQRQEEGDASRSIMVPTATSSALIQVHAPDPVAVPNLGRLKDGAQLGQGIERDGPVAQDAGFAHAGEQEDLLHAGSGAIEATGGLGIPGEPSGSEDEIGRAVWVAGIGGYAEEVEDLGRAGADVEISVYKQ